uniref:Uncharacterized protein n=1 Tax=Anguilla anguilla TaxID=7936 RepID=A0A0E9T9V9_ANGAN
MSVITNAAQIQNKMIILIFLAVCDGMK